LLRQQLKQHNETIATLIEQMSRVQRETSQLFIVLLLAAFSQLHRLYSSVLPKKMLQLLNRTNLMTFLHILIMTLFTSEY